MWELKSITEEPLLPDCAHIQHLLPELTNHYTPKATQLLSGSAICKKIKPVHRWYIFHLQHFASD